MKGKAILLLPALVLVVGSAQHAPAAAPDHLLTGYSLTSWTDGDGVPLGTVYAMGQDRDGYLWVGADAGLLRFDGLRFTPWEVLSDAALPKSSVSAVRVSTDGSLWAGFADGGGVRRLRDGQMQPRDQPHGKLGSVTDLVEDAHGTMWAVSDSALYRLRDDQWQKLTPVWEGHEPPVLHPYVKKGQLFVGTSRGMFRLVETTDSFQRMSAGYVWDISEDTAGVVWITDIVAGFRRLGEPPSPRRPLEGAGYRLMHDRHGNLWVATLGEGLWRVRGGSSPIIEKTALRTGLSSDAVQAVLEDRDGNVWVGTTGGLHRLTQRKLTPIEDVGFVVAIESGDDSSVWAGTTNGLVRFSAASGQWQREGSGPGVRILHRDAEGTLWIGTNDSLWRLANGALTRVRLPPQYPLTPITTITSASGRGVWLGYDDWLVRWDGTTLIRFEVPPGAGTTIKRITLARADRQGRLWIAFDDGKLGFVDRGGAFRALGSNEGLDPRTHTAIYAIFEDSDGVIWVGGSGGLSRFAGERFVTVNHDSGLPGNRVWAIVDDADGYLWLSLDRGLVRLSRHEFTANAAARGRRIQYKLYDTSDGLAGAPLGSIRAARAANGRLWFVRGGGLTVADPRALGVDRTFASAPLRIEAAVANERRLGPAPQTALPPGTRRLQINYTALTLTASNKIRFRYRLDGFDTDWIDAGTRRVAFYTNLSPRRYRFQVEANSDDGTWNASTAAWDFAIRPAFYQTIWFYTLSVVATALLVWGSWRFRLRLVRRQFSLVLAERARLSREIHDTLLQSLVGVALQFDAISDTLDASSSAARDQLVRIRRQVEGYIREARQSIWDLRSPVLETHDLTAALREFGKQATAGQAVRFAATVSGTPRQCPAKVENQLLRIGQEAITNAVRHAEAKRIHVELRFDDRSVALRVSDDGRGFDFEHAAHEMDSHYGLTTMKERALELGAQFNVATGAGQGTAVETVVPTALGVGG